MALDRRVGSVTMLIALMFVAGACGGGSDAGGSADLSEPVSEDQGADNSLRQRIAYSGDGGSARFDAMAPVQGAEDSTGTTTGGAASSGTAAGSSGEVVPQPAELQDRDALRLGPSVIKTADLNIEVPKDEFRSAVREAVTIAERYGGFVLSSSVDDQKRGSSSATLRIPAERFGTALAALRDLGEVKREEVAGEDVTQEFIDLEARLRNFRAQERVLLDLMADAQSVTDTIRVQSELSGIQLEIERLRGRLHYLDDLVTFSTIFVNMQEQGAAPAPKVGMLQEAWNNAVEGFFGVIGAVIVAAGVIFPIGVLVLIAFLGIRWVRPIVARRLGTREV